jgi:hypothetical protein
MTTDDGPRMVWSRGALLVGTRKIPDIPGHGDSNDAKPPRREALLPGTFGARRFVIRATRERGGWRAVQSQVGDGIS